MAAVNGNTIILKVATVEVASCTDLSFDSTAEMLDISDKSTEDAQFIQGKRTDTITLNAFYLVAGAAAAMRTAYEAGTVVAVVWDEDGSDLRTGNAHVSSLSVSAPANSAAEVSATLQMTGGWS